MKDVLLPNYLTKLRKPVMGVVSAAAIAGLAGCGESFSGKVYEKYVHDEKIFDLVNTGNTLANKPRIVHHYMLKIALCPTNEPRTKEQIENECRTREQEVKEQVYKAIEERQVYPPVTPTHKSTK